MTESILQPFSYHTLGSGPDILLAFHGIGQNGKICFEPFAAALGDRYTIFAFDLPFHGDNAAPAFDNLLKSELKQQLSAFLAKNNVQTFDVAGFSIGGRFALAVLEAFPQKINHVFLIAPDGISEHPLYILATKFSATRRIFKWSMNHPALFFKIITLLEKAGLLNASLVRVTRKMLDTPEKRETVYKSWVAFRSLRFDMENIVKTTAENKIGLHLFAGKFDKLLKPKYLDKLARLLPPENVHVLKCGHSQLVEKAGSHLRDSLTL